MEKKPLSIKAISELTGVSIATVSRIINQNGRFSAETERRVKEAIEKHGYVPNMVARGLRTNELPIVGVIVPDITNEFFAKIVLDIQMLLFDHSISVIICNTNEQDELERLHLQTLRAQNVCGLVYISTGNEVSNIAPKVPTIFIDRKPTGMSPSQAVAVTSDNEMGGFIATQELVRKGCQDIAILISQRKYSTTLDRLIGYQKALEQSGLPVREDLYLPVAAVTHEEAYQNTCRLIQSGKQFDGIVCGTDWLAVGALAALRVHGITVPDQVKVVGFDDISAAQMHTTPITTVHQDTPQMARIAVEQFLRLREGNPISQRHFVIPTWLVTRETT